jgi:hypothetical protein
VSAGEQIRLLDSGDVEQVDDVIAIDERLDRVWKYERPSGVSSTFPASTRRRPVALTDW